MQLTFNLNHTMLESATQN